MKNKEIVCTKCSCWVDCSRGEETYGFCLTEPLFTYTAKTRCSDFIDGTPLTEKEFDEANY